MPGYNYNGGICYGFASIPSALFFFGLEAGEYDYNYSPRADDKCSSFEANADFVFNMEQKILIKNLEQEIHATVEIESAIEGVDGYSDGVNYSGYVEFENYRMFLKLQEKDFILKTDGIDIFLN